MTGKVRVVRWAGVAAAGTLVAAFVATGSNAAPSRRSIDSGSTKLLVAEPDHRIGINAFMVGSTRSGAKRAIRSAEVASLRFAFGVDLLSEHWGNLTTETIRLTLPGGLSWGESTAEAKTLFPNGVPSRWSFAPESESCMVNGRIATCTATGVPGGTALLGWVLDVVAAAPGTYKITAELSPADGFTRPSGRLNGRAILTVVVGPPRLTVGVPRLMRAKLRPSVVDVVIPMTSNGAPVSPASGRFSYDGCVARMAEDPGYEKKRALGHPGGAGPGFVRCSIYFNNAQYRGMTLVGEVHLRVAGKPVVRKFSVRLGDGSALSRAVGAVIDTSASNAKRPPSK